MSPVSDSSASVDPTILPGFESLIIAVTMPMIRDYQYQTLHPAMLALIGKS